MAYAYRRSITIDHTLYRTFAGGADLTGYPMLVHETVFRSVAHGGHVQSASGYDIVFCSDKAGTTLLNWQVDFYDPATGEIWVWVQIPTVHFDANTVIYCWYGNPAITTPQSPDSPWDSHYKLIAHLPNGTTLSAADSSQSANAGTIDGATATAGVMDGAAAFDGSSADIDYGNPAALQIAGQITIEAWIKPSAYPALNTSAYIVSKGADAAQDNRAYFLRLNNAAGNVYLYVGCRIAGTTYGAYVLATAAVPLNVWSYVVGRYDGSAWSLAINGTVLTPSSPTVNGAQGNALRMLIGAEDVAGTKGSRFSGSAEEIRISDSARAPGYIRANYVNQLNFPRPLYILGFEQQPNLDGFLLIYEAGVGLVDRTSYIDWGEYRNLGFSGVRGGQGPLSVTLYIPAGESYEPATGSPVYLRQGGIGVWAGSIQRKEIRWIDDAGNHVLTLTCISIEQYLNKRQIPPITSYGLDNPTVTDMFMHLMRTVAVGEPVDIGVVTSSSVLPPVEYKFNRLTDILDSLAASAGLIWYIDPDTMQISMVEEGSAAAWTLTSTDILHGSISWLEDMSNYRNCQRVELMSTDQVVPDIQPLGTFGFGIVDYELPTIVGRMLEVQQVTEADLQARAEGAFLGISTDGDTITIGPITYRMVAALDTAAGGYQVLIEPHLGVLAHNLYLAVNAVPSAASIKYVAPARNPQVWATEPSGHIIQVHAHAAGSIGNAIAISFTGTAFNWSGATHLGLGVDFEVVATLDCGPVTDQGIHDVYYTPGSTKIRFHVAPAAGLYYLFHYYQPGADVVTIEDTDAIAALALIENGTGRHEQMMSAQTSNIESAADSGSKALAAYEPLLRQVDFSTWRPGLIPGTSLTCALTKPANAASKLNFASWMIQEIQASMPEPGMPDGQRRIVAGLPPDMRLLFRVSLVNISGTQTEQQFWEQVLL